MINIIKLWFQIHIIFLSMSEHLTFFWWNNWRHFVFITINWLIWNWYSMSFMWLNSKFCCYFCLCFLMKSMVDALRYVLRHFIFLTVYLLNFFKFCKLLVFNWRLCYIWKWNIWSSNIYFSGLISRGLIRGLNWVYIICYILLNFVYFSHHFFVFFIHFIVLLVAYIVEIMEN